MILPIVKELEAKNHFCTLTSAITVINYQNLPINNFKRGIVGPNAYGKFE